MYAALWIPRYHLQALLRMQNAPAMPDIAVLDPGDSAKKGSPYGDDRLICVSEAAERQGVFIGMTASQAQARCERLRLVYREKAAEEAVQDLLLECALSWTPNFESASPDLCVMDLSRAGRISGGADSCGRGILSHLKTQRLEGRLGFAANVDLATLAAFVADPMLIIGNHQRDEKSVLHQLPMRALRPSPGMSAILQAWGIETLGHFLKLSRQDIATRLGNEGLTLWDLAAGNRERLLSLIRPAIAYREGHDLEHSVECLEPLLFLLRGMLDRLCGRLSDVWLVAAALLLTLRFADDQRHHRELRIAEPTRDAEVLFRVLHSHLDGLTASAPITHIALEIRPIRAANSQPLLFEKSLRDPNRFAETISQIEAILGPGSVGRAVLIPRHRTDSFRIAAFLEPQEKDPRLAELPAPLHGLPLRRFRPAITVRVMCSQGIPVVLHTDQKAVPLTQATGPCLLSGDWWDTQQWRHEVWDAADEEGTLYRLIRQSDIWTLDGIYG